MVNHKMWNHRCRACWEPVPAALRVRVRVHGRSFRLCPPCARKVRIARAVGRVKVDTSMNKRLNKGQGLYSTPC